VHQYCIMSAPTMSQKAGIEAIEHGSGDVAFMKQSYNERRNLVYQSFLDMGLDCVKPDGAFYIFPSIRSTGLSSKEFAMRLLDEEAVACVPGSAFGECGEGFLRCSYATRIDKIREAMTRMARFVGKIRKA
jgi:aminotransferase